MVISVVTLDKSGQLSTAPVGIEASSVAGRGGHGSASHTKIAPLPSKITYIKMDPLRSIRNGFANGNDIYPLTLYVS